MRQLLCIYARVMHGRLLPYDGRWHLTDALAGSEQHALEQSANISQGNIYYSENSLRGLAYTYSFPPVSTFQERFMSA